MVAYINSSTLTPYSLTFSKAFGCIPHKRLLYKLTRLSIDTTVITWIVILSHRFQSVVINDCISPPQHVKSGMPRGWVLKLLLFLIYIYDIRSGIKSNVRPLADNCTIYHFHKNNLTGSTSKMTYKK